MKKIKEKRQIKDFAFFPWDKGEKPYFVNEDGYEWYLDKSLTKYAHQENNKGITLKDIFVFFIKKKNVITRAIVDNKQNLLYENTAHDAVAAYIDRMKLQKEFEKE